MQLSINIGDLFTELPLLERPGAAKSMGFKSVDFKSPFEASPDDWEHALSEARCQLLSFDFPMGDFLEGGEGILCSPEQQGAFETALERSLEYVDRLEVDSVNIVSGSALTTAKGKAWKTLIQRSVMLADALEKRGKYLTIEPLSAQGASHLLVYNFETALDFISDVDYANVAMQIDIYEMHNMELGLTEQLRLKAKWIRRIQLCDFPKRHEPGTGNMNLVDIERALVEGHFKGWLSAAYEPCTRSSESFDWIDTLNIAALSERLQS